MTFTLFRKSESCHSHIGVASSDLWCRDQLTSITWICWITAFGIFTHNNHSFLFCTSIWLYHIKIQRANNKLKRFGKVQKSQKKVIDIIWKLWYNTQCQKEISVLSFQKILKSLKKVLDKYWKIWYNM